MEISAAKGDPTQAGVGKSNGERRIQEPVLERCLQDNDLVAVLKVTVLNDSASDDASSAH
jgi:hypothetical protein